MSDKQFIWTRCRQCQAQQFYERNTSKGLVIGGKCPYCNGSSIDMAGGPERCRPEWFDASKVKP